MKEGIRIRITPNIHQRLNGLDDLARILFPMNKNHQKTCVVLWLEIKYTEDQFLTTTTHIPSKYGISQRTVEIVRAKLKKIGLIRRVSHFSPKHGYRSGWEFTDRLDRSLSFFQKWLKTARKNTGLEYERRRDEHAIHFIT